MRLVLLNPGPVYLYASGQPEPDVNGCAYPYLVDPGRSDQSAAWSGGGIIPNLVVICENEQGQMVDLVKVPPREARLEDDDGNSIFSGIISSIRLNNQAQIEVIT